jgi:hypothetical protein
MAIAMPHQSDDLTLGEKLFEQACAATGIRCLRLRVAKVAGFQRPDYKVAVSDCGAIVEVKQIDRNRKERRQAEEVAAGRPVAWRSTPGARLRGLIRSGSAQLQRVSRRGIPTAVAIFDGTFSLSCTDPYNVKVAMYGLDEIVLALPEGLTPYHIGMKSGGKEVLTKKHNTSVSAVIIIRKVPPSEGPMPILLVYHNHFARVPFDYDRLRGYVCDQFALGQTGDWVAV